MTVLEIANGRLSVRACDVVLLLDGAAWSVTQAEAASSIRGLASNAGSRCLPIFWSDEFSPRVNGWDDRVKSAALANRGRFATPLVETGLLDSGGVLVCFTAGPVPDWVDWGDAIVEAFDQVVQVRLKNDTPVLSGATVIEAVGLTLEVLESTVLVRIYSIRPVGLTLRFVGGLPLSLDGGFTCRAIAEAPNEFTAFERSLESSIPYEVELSVVGQGQSVGLSATLTRSDGSIQTADDAVLVSDYPQPAWRFLDERDTDIFRQGCESYLAREGRHDCVSCGESHAFSRAFVCDKKSGQDYFASETLAFGGVSIPTSGELLVFAEEQGRLRVFSASASPVLSVGDRLLLKVGEEWVAVARDGSVGPRSESLWRGFDALESERLWVLRVGARQ